LFVELVIVSISPVPKLEPGPVSYFQLAELTGDPAAPAKLSLNTVVQPAGGLGTVVAEAGCVINAAATSTPPKSIKTDISAAVMRFLRAAGVGAADHMSDISGPPVPWTNSDNGPAPVSRAGFCSGTAQILI
jgi:hypothetical protein